jgi:predicted kinase
LKSLIVLRGLPGSGKTTLAHVLADGGHWPVFSIDDYFTDPITGAYLFVHTENHLAYARCLELTEKAMVSNTEKVILHNVFSMDWEMEPYRKLAALHGYRMFVATVENRHDGRNQHHIPDDQIEKMAGKFEVKLK